MRTPREIVECIYDGANYQPFRLIQLTCGEFEELIASVQVESFEVGRVSGIRQSCAAVHAISRGTHSEERSVILDNCEAVILEELQHDDFHRDSD